MYARLTDLVAEGQLFWPPLFVVKLNVEIVNVNVEDVNGFFIVFLTLLCQAEK